MCHGTVTTHRCLHRTKHIHHEHTYLETAFLCPYYGETAVFKDSLCPACVRGESPEPDPGDLNKKDDRLWESLGQAQRDAVLPMEVQTGGEERVKPRATHGRDHQSKDATGRQSKITSGELDMTEFRTHSTSTGKGKQKVNVNSGQKGKGVKSMHPYHVEEPDEELERRIPEKIARETRQPKRTSEKQRAERRNARAAEFYSYTMASGQITQRHGSDQKRHHRPSKPNLQAASRLRVDQEGGPIQYISRGAPNLPGTHDSMHPHGFKPCCCSHGGGYPSAANASPLHKFSSPAHCPHTAFTGCDPRSPDHEDPYTMFGANPRFESGERASREERRGIAPSGHMIMRRDKDGFEVWGVQYDSPDDEDSNVWDESDSDLDEMVPMEYMPGCWRWMD